MADRLTVARRRRCELAEAGIHFAPIRHHSPACALAVRALIREVRPASVLIEMPSSFDALLPVLTSPDTAPPVAVLALRRGETGTVSSFYPLADFSPEWAALREASKLGAAVAFIDQVVESRAGSDVTALMAERYYAESQTLAALARQEHCRDHDELWEHLFELRPAADCADWRHLFGDVFAWSALARFDYEPEVLAAEGSLAREAAMVAHIDSWRARATGPLVVVTGAFHTPALIEALSPAAAGRALTCSNPQPDAPGSGDGNWLIRYDLTRLDSYSGYGAGVRSPGYYQRLWELIEAQPLGGLAELASGCLVDIASHANAARTADRISLAELAEACLQAERLAQLRGHPWPGRTDLLDACTSCFAKGEALPPAVRDGIGHVFGGSKLGRVPKDTPAPPIVAEARDLAVRLRFKVDDSARRHTVLEVRRSAQARRRARFLALMAYLRVGFASQTAGPDYVSGRALGRVREEWDYAWTPMVEAALIGLAADGASLAEAAQTRLRRAESALADSPQRRSTAEHAKLVAQAALIGLTGDALRLVNQIDAMVESDHDLGSVVGCARYLLGLWRSRAMLEIASPHLLAGAAAKALPQAAYLIDQAAVADPAAEATLIEQVIAAAALADELVADAGSVDGAPISQALGRLRARPNTAPGLAGCAWALAVQSGQTDEAELSARLRAVFAAGADPFDAVRFLSGLMRAAPDLLLHVPELFEAIDDTLGGIDDQAFLSFLPDLRQAFSWLKPLETAQLAQKVAARTGLTATAVAANHWAVSPQDLGRGIDLELRLLQSLEADGLGGGGNG
ncbi:MAG: DUF5682 family protein [Bifidobacteriaceae bacterium]|nr:DUF5682 family protein [Bifidobacteriaceae bacterium]